MVRREYRKWSSTAIGRDMETLVFGESDQTLLWFPCQGGRFHEFEDFGMVEVVRPFLEAGRLQVLCVESVDNEAWAAMDRPLSERGRMANAYDAWLARELLPSMGFGEPGPMVWSAGCSMGGYHAINFLFRHPDQASGCISLSGLSQLSEFVGGSMDENVYLHSPLHFLPHLRDPWFLERLRRARIVICAGRGAWEDAMIADAEAMRKAMADAGIPATVDLWGADVNHDWPWWRKQLPYFIGKMLG